MFESAYALGGHNRNFIMRYKKGIVKMKILVFIHLQSICTR